MSRLEALKPRLVDSAFAAGWAAVPRLPRRVAVRAFDAAAAISVRRRCSYAQLRRNLRQVIGPEASDERLETLVHQSVASYTRYWRETFQLPSMDPIEVATRTELRGWEHVRRPLEQGRGVVVALTHSGNWDSAAFVLCKVIGIPMSTVAERLAPESLFERFTSFREGLGMQVAPLTGGAEPSLSVLKRALRSGQMATLLADRDLLRTGIEVELCGRRTTMPSGPALLALQTGAALVPLELTFTAGGWRNHYHPEVVMPETGRLRDRVTVGIEALAAQFTEQLRRTPQDWHMLQQVWPDV